MKHLAIAWGLVGLAASGGLEHRAWAGEPAVGITRGPYIQALLSRSVSIAWRTMSSVECRVRLQEDGAPAPLEAISPRGMDHRVRLEGLAPGRLHRYEVLDGAGQPVPGGGPFEFRTAPDGGGSFRFVALGDSGTGSSKQHEIGEALCALLPSPELFIHTGDLVYSGDADTAIFAPYKCLLSRTCFYPARGNHDGLDWANLFFPPIEDEGETVTNYSFDWGSAHFATVDTSSASFGPRSTGIAWLEKDLEAARAAGAIWIILYTHLPVYSAGIYGNLAESTLAPLADKFQVDLVLSGHDHNYQRSHPVRESVARDAWQNPDYVSPRGTIYVVTGGGGAGLYPGGARDPIRTFVSEFHALDVQVTPERISVKSRGCAHGSICLGDDGILDAFTITKGSATRGPLRFRRGDMNFSGTVNLTDAVTLLEHLFRGRSLRCPMVGDCDLSGSLELADPITILRHLFLGGPALPHPYPDCGEAALEEDELCMECAG
jgi:hypothetical protein